MESNGRRQGVVSHPLVWFAAAVGAPTICGTGPVGGKVHSPEEFLELSSIVPRAQALALTVLRLT